MSRIDGSRTGWTIEDCVGEIESWGDDPEKHFYYVSYSDIYHTSPDCPHIQNSERLHVAERLTQLNGPLIAGANRVVSPIDGGEDIDQCSWCEKHSDRDGN